MLPQRKLILDSFQATSQINIKTPFGEFDKFSFDENRIYIKNQKRNLKLSFEHEQFFSLVHAVDIKEQSISIQMG